MQRVEAGWFSITIVFESQGTETTEIYQFISTLV